MFDILFEIADRKVCDLDLYQNLQVKENKRILERNK